ncbi:MAG: hypothetical protein WC385_01020 [Candidatus Paceibacterota bacterium]|jgi:hypothetical protein
MAEKTGVSIESLAKSILRLSPKSNPRFVSAISRWAKTYLATRSPVKISDELSPEKLANLLHEASIALTKENPPLKSAEQDLVGFVRELISANEKGEDSPLAKPAIEAIEKAFAEAEDKEKK